MPVKILCAIVSLLFLASCLSAQQPVPQFEKDIRDYAWRAMENPPVPGCTLFVGSSSFRIWGNKLETTFAQNYAVNRGFGGSHFTHNIAALDRIHLPCKPDRIVIFCGTNDIASGKSVETVYADFRYYIARIWNENPVCKIDFVTLTHAPVREKHWDNGDKLCEKVRQLAEKDPCLNVIDIITPMQGPDGRVREDLFVQDRLHLNEQGYAVWEAAFKDAFYSKVRDEMKHDVHELFRARKALGLFDDPRFEQEGVTIHEPAADVRLDLVFIGTEEKRLADSCAIYLRRQAGVHFDRLSIPEGGPYTNIVEAAQSLGDDKDARLVFSVMLAASGSAEEYRKNLREMVDGLLADFPESLVVLHRHHDAKRSVELEPVLAFYATTPNHARVRLGDTKAFRYFKRHEMDAEALGRFHGAAILDAVR